MAIPALGPTMNALAGDADGGAIVPNARRLLWAGSVAILAAGVGFGIRGGIFANWGAEFGFTATQLGAIGGAGFSGFCFGIVFGGLICDRIGYGKLITLAFALHVLSAVVTFTAGGAGAYASLYWGMFIFAYANGTLEAVSNPLVATLFPGDRTHYPQYLARELACGSGARRRDRMAARRSPAMELAHPTVAISRSYTDLWLYVFGATLPEIRGVAVRA